MFTKLGKNIVKNTLVIRSSSRYIKSEPKAGAAQQMGQKVKIYTKTGDQGTTTLYNMERISKNADYFHVLGDVDELNAYIGLASYYCKEAGNGIDAELDKIQSRLLDLGACVATPLSSSPEKRINRTIFPPEYTSELEFAIDQLDQHLPNIVQFILPSGGQASSVLHIARTTCRRAERGVVDIVNRGDMEPSGMKFLNRLSDYLFTAARYAAQYEGKQETLYKRYQTRTNINDIVKDEEVPVEDVKQ